MRHTSIGRLGTRVAGVLIGTAILACAPTRAAAQNVVVDWNAIAVTAAGADGKISVMQQRFVTISSVAVSDAVNAITNEYARYGSRLTPPSGASTTAAAIGAAYRALTQVLPSQAQFLGTKLAESLATFGVSAADPGFVFGEAVADEIVAMRSADGALAAQYPYTAPNAGAPGVWVPTPPAFAAASAPGWGSVKPWVLESGAQFRPDEGLELTSDRYARDLNELKEIGALNSATRTAEQTNIARFWLTSAMVIWNDVLRQVALGLDLDESESARDFALMNIAAADAGIACWDAKYAFNFWRPITAIRRADEDGNPATEADPAWTPLVATPNHPEYPSGHATISGAMATVLRLLFGDDPGVALTATSPTNPGFERHWTTFSEGALEVLDARVYAGFHFRSSDERGARIGAQVARFAAKHAFRHMHGK
jgi:PAP2 superfamily